MKYLARFLDASDPTASLKVKDLAPEGSFVQVMA